MKKREKAPKNKNWKKHVIKKSKEEIMAQVKMVVVAVIGGLVAAGSFLLYFKLKEFAVVTVLICVIDVVYAYFNAKMFLTSQDWKGVRGILIFLFLLFYYTVVFAFLAICASRSDRGFINEVFLYPIFLMPSFVIVIILLLLILSGL